MFQIVKNKTFFNLVSILMIYIQFYFFPLSIKKLKEIKIPNVVGKKQYFVKYNDKQKIVVDIDRMSFINRGVHGHFDQGSYVFFDPDIVITDPGNYLYFSQKEKKKKIDFNFFT